MRIGISSIDDESWRPSGEVPRTDAPSSSSGPMKIAGSVGVRPSAASSDVEVSRGDSRRRYGPATIRTNDLHRTCAATDWTDDGIDLVRFDQRSVGVRRRDRARCVGPRARRAGRPSWSTVRHVAEARRARAVDAPASRVLVLPLPARRPSAPHPTGGEQGDVARRLDQLVLRPSSPRRKCVRRRSTSFGRGARGPVRRRRAPRARLRISRNDGGRHGRT